MSIQSLPNKIINFFKESKLELKKVNWPTRQETLRYALIVVAVSLVVAGYLGGLDVIFKRFLIERLINL